MRVMRGGMGRTEYNPILHNSITSARIARNQVMGAQMMGSAGTGAWGRRDAKVISSRVHAQTCLGNEDASMLRKGVLSAVWPFARGTVEEEVG